MIAEERIGSAIAQDIVVREYRRALGCQPLPWAAMANQEFEITPEEAHERLDVVLARRLHLSRAQTRKLLETGSVSLDGSPVDRSVKGLAVETGARVGIAGFVHPRDWRVVPDPDAPLALLAEGPGWIGVDKPAGQAVHPLEADERGTLLNALVARWPEMQGVGEGGLRSGILHRLDLDTSGAMLFASDAAVWDRIRGAFARHEIRKTYRALVAGATPDASRIDLRLVIAQHKPAYVRVAQRHGGHPTRMSFRTLERFAMASLVEVALETGFLHQVRVGFAHEGHPVLGDALYGSEAAGAAPRQMLHCARLVLEEIVVESPDPDDLVQAIARQRGDA